MHSTCKTSVHIRSQILPFHIGATFQDDLVPQLIFPCYCYSSSCNPRIAEGTHSRTKGKQLFSSTNMKKKGIPFRKLPHSVCYELRECRRRRRRGDVYPEEQGMACTQPAYGGSLKTGGDNYSLVQPQFSPILLGGGGGYLIVQVLGYGV